jgi:ribosome assembly protein 1
MLYPDLFESHVEPKSKLEKDLYACDASESAHVIAYVSKMFAVSTTQLPEHKKHTVTVDELRVRALEARVRAEESREQSRTASPSAPPSPSPGYVPSETLTGESPGDLNPASETLLGFARLYSGVIRVGSTVACVLPKYNNEFEPTHPRNRSHVVNATIDALYTMMGRDLVAVDSVSAGNIFAIRGLDGSVWRTATICAPSAAGLQGEHSQGWMTNLGSINRQVCQCFVYFDPYLELPQAPPIVRVALEPAIPADMPKLIRGMKLLSHADPCVETFQQSTGEHVILTAGELHLEVCSSPRRFSRVKVTQAGR